MKRSHRIAVGILASASLGLAALSAHAHPGAAGGMGAGSKQHQGQAAGAAQQERMAQHRGEHGAKQRHAGAGSAEGCPMHAQRSAQTTHNH